MAAIKNGRTACYVSFCTSKVPHFPRTLLSDRRALVAVRQRPLKAVDVARRLVIRNPARAVKTCA